MDDARARWISFCRRWTERQIKPETLEVLRAANRTELIEVLQAEIKEVLSRKISDASWRAGLDLFAQVMTVRAIDGAIGHRPIGSNDAGGVEQLQQLVDEDVTFLTNNKRLRQSVRESGSPQSHRVLAMDELLTRAP